MPKAIMLRRLQLIILGHIWVLAPLALLWFARPAWRGPDAPSAVRALVVLGILSGAYLATRTALALSGRVFPRLWPYLDIILVTAALVIVRSPSDPISALYFIPLASAAASLSPGQVAAAAGATSLAYLAVIVYLQTPWTVGLAYRLVIIGLIASLYGWVIHVVSAFERQAERAEYRTALAREIHDGIQYVLVTMGARLELARRLIGEAPARADQILVEERAALRRASDEMRYLVRRLRTTAGGDLATALRAQVSARADGWPFALEVDVPPALPRLAPAAEHALLRVIQESLTNAAKHAQASSVEVTVTPEGTGLRCVVWDDGVGFEAAADGGGLAGLRARVLEAGGSLDVASRPGGGTTVTATFPGLGGARWQPSAS